MTIVMIMMIVEENIILSSMGMKMWSQLGGVIGDKVTLMFRLFNTHLFYHPLFPLFKSRVFPPREKVMSAERATMGGVWAFQMGAVTNCQPCGLTTRPFLSDRQLFPAVLHRAAFLRFSTFFQAIEKRTLGAFSCRN